MLQCRYCNSAYNLAMAPTVLTPFSPSLPPSLLPSFQELSHHFGAEVAPGEKREYGKAMVSRAKVGREGGREEGKGVGKGY